MAGQDKKGQRTSNESSPDANASSGEPAFRFHYDALDTLTGRSTSSGKEHRFYRNDELANEIQGGVSRTFLRAEGTVLAEQQVGGEQTPLLLAGDEKNSVLAEVSQDAVKAIAYSAYGHRTADAAVSSPFGYNGERRETQTGWYLLGNGYRVFNPLLMRFHSPDSSSPFGEGGLNAYMYCVGDPINHVDPTGHISLVGSISRGFRSLFGSSRITTATPGINPRLKVPETVLGRNPNAPRATSLYPIEEKHIRRLGARVELLDYKAEKTRSLKNYMEYKKQAELTKNDLEFAKENVGKIGITKHGAKRIKGDEKEFEEVSKIDAKKDARKEKAANKRAIAIEAEKIRKEAASRPKNHDRFNQ